MVFRLLKREVNDRLISEARRGNIKEVRSLLNHKCDLNHQNRYGWNALMSTTIRGHEDVARLLMNEGSDLKLRDGEGRTTVMLAAEYGHGSIVDLLLAKNVELDAQNHFGLTALMLAASNCHEEVVTKLINAGADDQIVQVDKGWPALLKGAIEGNEKMVHTLVKGRSNVEMKDKKGNTAIMLAAGEGHVSVVEILRKGNAIMSVQNHNGSTAVMYAARFGHDAVVKIFVTARVDLDVKNRLGLSALMLAAEHGHKEVVQTLLDARVKINESDIKGWTAVMIAAKNSHKEIVKALVKDKADLEFVNQESWTALMYMAKHGLSDVVKFIFDYRADEPTRIEHRNNEGRNALMLACINGHTEVVSALIDAKVNLENKDNKGMTALMHAAKEGHSNIVEKLLGARALLDVVNEENWTVTMFAAENGNSEIIDMVCHARANVNIQNHLGHTAIMLASMRGHKEIVTKLRRAKADLYLRDNNGKTVFDFVLSDEIRFVLKNGRGEGAVGSDVDKSSQQSSKNNDGGTTLDTGGRSRRDDSCSKSEPNKVDVEYDYDDSPQAEAARKSSPLYLWLKMDVLKDMSSDSVVKIYEIFDEYNINDVAKLAQLRLTADNYEMMGINLRAAVRIMSHLVDITHLSPLSTPRVFSGAFSPPPSVISDALSHNTSGVNYSEGFRRNPALDICAREVVNDESFQKRLVDEFRSIFLEDNFELVSTLSDFAGELSSPTSTLSVSNVLKRLEEMGENAEDLEEFSHEFSVIIEDMHDSMKAQMEGENGSESQTILLKELGLAVTRILDEFRDAINSGVGSIMGPISPPLHEILKSLRDDMNTEIGNIETSGKGAVLTLAIQSFEVKVGKWLSITIFEATKASTVGEKETLHAHGKFIIDFLMELRGFLLRIPKAKRDELSNIRSGVTDLLGRLSSSLGEALAHSSS